MKEFIHFMELNTLIIKYNYGKKEKRKKSNNS